MAISKELTAALQENLDKVAVPSNSAALRDKLMRSRPTHTAPAIKQSPENSLDIGSSKIEIE